MVSQIMPVNYVLKDIFCLPIHSEWKMWNYLKYPLFDKNEQKYIFYIKAQLHNKPTYTFFMW